VSHRALPTRPSDLIIAEIGDKIQAKRNTYYVLKRFLLAMVFLIPSFTNSTASAAEEYLLSVDMNLIDQWSNNNANLLPNSAKLKQVRYRIPRSNPDNLIGQIVLDYPLNDKQELYNSKWNVGLWIYGQALYCAGDKNCDFILNVYAKYPKSLSILTWKKSTDEKSVTSDCSGSHYISNEDGKSIINYSMSISCLNLPKQFASYAYSGYDIGITPTPYDFTAGGYVENPFHQLAKISYDKNGGKEGLSRLDKSEAMEKLESSVEKARLSFDNLNYKYQNLAPQLQAKLDGSRDWKNFLVMDEQLLEIESKIENNSLSDAQIPNEVSRVIKIINSQTSGLRAIMKLVPSHQCYNEVEDLRTILSKSKSCPKGFKKVKT
jgi:hypothetical protein